MLQKIKERIFAGGEITPDEALELAQKPFVRTYILLPTKSVKNSVIKRLILARSSMPVLVIVPKTANGAPNRPIITPK